MEPKELNKEAQSFSVMMYGTRGSSPVSSADNVRYGGNTTCLRILSNCIPKGTALVVDTGSGFLPLVNALLAEGIKQVYILYTHWHPDHFAGVQIAAVIYIKGIPMHIYGPVQNAYGPKEVYEHLMKKPFFPVCFPEVASHLNFHRIEYPRTQVMLMHPEGGFKVMNLDAFERHVAQGKKLPLQVASYDLSECLVIRMHNTDHPEQTISYRFDEKTTGKSFCFLTDHESQRAIPLGLRGHLKDADLVVEDVQYDPITYAQRTAGFGHGTPDYAVELANLCGVKKLGFTHHDPGSSDAKIDQIVEIGRECAVKALAETGKGIDPANVFACADYQLLII